MTAASGELGISSHRGTSTFSVERPDFLARLERWQLGPSLVTAAEVIESAIMSAREKEGVSAAKAILADGSPAAPLIKAQAASLLLRAGLEDEVPDQFRAHPAIDAGRPRQILRLHPRDALAWVELAFAQTVAGHPRAAEQSMTVALQLSPNNRHVLRSASRLFLHLEKKDKAYDVIARNAATRADPWLVAAEIALAEVAERDPRLLKVGLSMLDSKSFSPHHLTELAGAAGTQELLDGSRKRAKRLFLQSMIAPTGSSLAQAEWATPSLGVEVIEARKLTTATEPFEAFAFHLYREGRFSEVSENCERWAEVEAFSIRPFEFGSIAAGHAEQFDKAVQLASEGLKRRPNSPLLLNCQAYALASSDKPEEAGKALSKIKLPYNEPRMKFLTVANHALVNFRKGQAEEGIILYRAAIDGFHRAGMRAGSAQARVYLAREAVRAKLSGAKRYVAEAQEAMRPFPASEAARVLRRIEIEIGEKPREVPQHVTPPDVDNAAKPQPLPQKEIRWTTPGWKGLNQQ
ncbi:hypothetical protein [Rhizobium rhizogenes]|uniref:hypothetical protein n=1 Tax=Rhizobium rhizogenes TaxID=359 RepID=UPI001573EEFC|nr:hypothetical protein [Rhizobium rhizogenes]NTF91689.1 hypothetical protein [Rhizobium rhizogenes]NTG25524.1 hypothetical protein [Rhizobium rhizogenes]NTH23455.1 hypothetical protein [Rhizobium rhizogenes]